MTRRQHEGKPHMEHTTVVTALRCCAGAVAVCLSLATSAKEDMLAKALGDELKRTMAELRLDEAERPYFVAYRVVETAGTNASASMGGVVNQWQSHGRRLQVEMRVGSRTLDNTNFFSGRLSFGVQTTSLPLGDDYKELRRRIWHATDRAYKAALDDLAGKKAALQNKTKVEEVADFSEQSPHQVVDEGTQPALDTERVVATARDLSAVFKNQHHIFQSTVHVAEVQTTVTYRNSEGSSFVRSDPRVQVRVLANTQAEDGTELGDFVAVQGRAWANLPSQDEMAARTKEMIATLIELRTAPALDRYTGPVLFEGQAAAELVAQVLAPRLVALRSPVADNPMFERALAQMRNPFLDKLGARVLARSLSVVDDPTATAEDGTPLAGSYAVDDDGVPAKRTPLVSNGILKTLLTSRNPLPDLPTSTGNRRGETALPSNLFLSAKDGLGDDEMRAQLLALMGERDAEYGIVVRRISSPRMGGAGMFSVAAAMGQGPKVQPLTLAYKLFADGREELIGKAVLPTFDEGQFKDVVAASATRTFYATTVSPIGGPFASAFAASAGGGNLTTIATPSLLFEDVTVRRPPGNIPRPPVAPHPLARAMR